MSTIDDPVATGDASQEPITIDWPDNAASDDADPDTSEHVHAGPRLDDHLEVDGSPRPWPARLGEPAIVVASLVVNLWSLSINGWGNAYYAAAARSITQSWSNFFFASFDPGGWVTVDKPPLAFWLQAASVKVFGLSSWSVLAPSAVCGALAVWLLIVTVRRVWGRAAGVIAGVALATMPVAVAVARSNNPDMALVLAVVAAAWAVERASATGKRSWLLLAGGFIGAGFLAKLAAALIVLPAMWFAYLVAGPHSWRRRIVDLLAATGVILAVGAIWVGGVALTPAASRPFIGGSTDGTAWNLLTGYNGLGRVTGNTSGPQGFGGGRPPGGIGGFGGAGGRARRHRWSTGVVGPA